LSFTLPQDIADKVLSRFPRSEPRQRIALTLLGFDHEPTPEEKKVIAANTQQEYRYVNQILDYLREMNLFSSEIGSVPLFRFNEKNRLSADAIIGASKLESKQEVKPTEKTREEEQVRLQVISVEEKKAEASMEDKPEGIELPISKGVSPKVIKDLLDRQENFETVIKGEVGSIKEEIGSVKKLLEKVLEQPKQTPPVAVATMVPVVSGLKVQQAAAETPADQPANPGSAPQPVNPMDPFANMSKEEIIEFYQNNPTMAGRRLPGGLSETYVNSPPETIRKIIIEVTTYTQMLYEKALADGAFEGTFSDFLNWAPQKYFEDRGLALGWHKVERHPGGRYG